jgi:hypothetical protein
MTKAMVDVQPRLVVRPSDVSVTPLKDLRFLGAVHPDEASTSGPTSRAATGAVEADETTVDRLYEFADGTLLRLEEWDFVAAGGGILFQTESTNANVNGHPAFLIYKQNSLTGNAITELRWATDRKLYTLTLSGDARRSGKLDHLMQIARSLRD